MNQKIIFVTGTDTGVGKTLLAALLLYHLRQTGCHALAMKPFCCGSRSDARLLQTLQDDELTLDETNPFYFRRPLAPLVAAKGPARQVTLSDAIDRIRRIGRHCDRLLIEGCGGLLVPLGEGYTVADLIVKLNPQVVVASRNRLGTINHTLLTVETLQSLGVKGIKVVLLESPQPDLSSATNQKVLQELLPYPVFSLPFLGARATNPVRLGNNHKKVKKTLARLIG